MAQCTLCQAVELSVSAGLPSDATCDTRVGMQASSALVYARQVDSCHESLGPGAYVVTESTICPDPSLQTECL